MKDHERHADQRLRQHSTKPLSARRLLLRRLRCYQRDAGHRGGYQGAEARRNWSSNSNIYQKVKEAAARAKLASGSYTLSEPTKHIVTELQYVPLEEDTFPTRQEGTTPVKRHLEVAPATPAKQRLNISFRDDCAVDDAFVRGFNMAYSEAAQPNALRTAAFNPLGNVSKDVGGDTNDAADVAEDAVLGEPAASGEADDDDTLLQSLPADCQGDW
ncbi:hypothetical protein COO60DRAFT_1463582 [Scenedesmus sp. NREL 46B-D3]|nr:hypothetical protein COO60DRAFT_1463582 [Scenedesmus sp. NREL 46B-D3]